MKEFTFQEILSSSGIIFGTVAKKLHGK